MNEDINKIKVQIKENINALLNNRNLKEAKLLINEYKKISPEDIEVYSLDAVIAIMEGNLEEAENVIQVGLKIDDNNFELLYNLAYVYKQKKELNKALIYYKRARTFKYYESEIKVQIDEIIKDILSNNRDILDKEYQKNELYRCLSKIENVMFIDFNLTEKVNSLAKSLYRYGINIDLAYHGIRPENRFDDKELVYRKLIAISNVNDLIEYINYYRYEIVHIFDIPNNIKLYMKKRCNSIVISDDELISVNINEVIKFYIVNKKSNNKIMNRNIVDSHNLTILIPTYNRPKYLKRVLSYFNSFKYIKPYILILDSSFEGNKLNNENIIKAFNNPEIEYCHFEPSINFFSKLNLGIEKIVTDYVVLCADDDFLTEEGIVESIRVLKKHKDLYSVKGKNLYFIESMAKLKEYDFFEGLYQDNIVGRLKCITKGFVPSLIYQVFRTDKFKKMYSFIENYFSELPENITFQEYLFYFMVICTGKLGKINVDLNIRDKSIPRETEVKNFPHAVIDGSFNNNYKKFCMFLSKYIEAMGHYKSEFDKNIPKIFENFLVNFLQVPKENISLSNDGFDIKKLEIGMRKSWVWPLNL